MADYTAVFAVGDSLVRFLTSSYQAAQTQLNLPSPCTFKLVSSTEIATEETTTLDQVVTLFLHRITTNEQFRGTSRLHDSNDKQPVLFLDLHYLITYWGREAQAEQKMLAWTMQQLQTSPILDKSILTTDAGWETTETVQLVSADLSLEDILRIWDALGPKYRLSISYIARVVRIDRTVATGLPVVATRFTLQDGVTS
jgi:Pvc16 N-terminal domain